MREKFGSPVPQASQRPKMMNGTLGTGDLGIISTNKIITYSFCESFKDNLIRHIQKEYIDQGYKDAQDWINNSQPLLRTKNAKKLLNLINKTSSNEWWKYLKKVER